MEESFKSIKGMARGAGIIFLGYVVSKLLTYLFRILLSRYNPENYGLFALSLSITVFIVTIATLGLDKAVYRYIPFYNEKGNFGSSRSIINLSLKYGTVFSLLLAFILFVSADWVATTFFSSLNHASFVLVLRIVILSIPLQVISKILCSSFRAYSKPEYEVYTKNFTEPVVKLGLALLFFIFGIGVQGMAIAYVLAILLSVLFSFFLLKKLIAPVEENIDQLDIFRYALPLILMSVFLTIMSSIDTITIGYFKDATAVGIYNVAVPTAQLMYMFPYSFLVIFLPTLTKYYVSSQKKEFKEVYLVIFKWLFLCLSLTFGIFVLYSKNLINILFGSEYILAYIPLIILSLGYLINFTVYPSENILLMLKKTKMIFWNSFFVLLLNVILNWYFIPLWGINGAALATAIAYVVWAFVLVFESYYYIRIFPLNLNFLKILIIITLQVVLFHYLGRYFEINNLFTLLVVLALFGLIFLLLILLLNILDKNDKAILRSMIYKIKAFKQ